MLPPPRQPLPRGDIHHGPLYGAFQRFDFAFTMVDKRNVPTVE